MGGGFDCFKNYHRRQYLEAADGDNVSLIEKVIRYAQKVSQEEESSQVSLFGGSSGVAIPLPTVPDVEPFSQLQKLNIEKEVVGLYISGHPLDQFKIEFKKFCNAEMSELNDLETLRSKGDIKVAGIVTTFAHRMTKTGKPFGTLTVEDYNGSYTFFLFSEDYVNYKEYFMQDWYLFIKGSVVDRKWGNGEPEFKISQISLLSEVRDKLVKGIKVNMSLDSIRPDILDDIEQLSKANPGDCSLSFNIIDIHESIQVDLLSGKYKIKPSNELIESLERLDNIEVSILT